MWLEQLPLLHVQMSFLLLWVKNLFFRGEAHCLADLDLQGDQGSLITALAKTGKPVVTIVMAGRPLTIGKEVEESTAVLYSFHPGTMGGPALADLSLGEGCAEWKGAGHFPEDGGTNSCVLRS